MNIKFICVHITIIFVFNIRSLTIGLLACLETFPSSTALVESKCLMSLLRNIITIDQITHVGLALIFSHFLKVSFLRNLFLCCFQDNIPANHDSFAMKFEFFVYVCLSYWSITSSASPHRLFSVFYPVVSPLPDISIYFPIC